MRATCVCDVDMGRAGCPIPGGEGREALLAKSKMNTLLSITHLPGEGGEALSCHGDPHQSCSRLSQQPHSRWLSSCVPWAQGSPWGDDASPQGTLCNVWRYLWWPQLVGAFLAFVCESQGSHKHSHGAQTAPSMKNCLAPQCNTIQP